MRARRTQIFQKSDMHHGSSTYADYTLEQVQEEHKKFWAMVAEECKAIEFGLVLS